MSRSFSYAKRLEKISKYEYSTNTQIVVSSSNLLFILCWLQLNSFGTRYTANRSEPSEQLNSPSNSIISALEALKRNKDLCYTTLYSSTTTSVCNRNRAPETHHLHHNTYNSFQSLLMLSSYPLSEHFTIQFLTCVFENTGNHHYSFQYQNS